ncbi:hypothetical protein BD414DRAFT_493863 [Trametes punicea]|nr:hypothetical protein BD414DRAFT_493863 [Trametes punicea]
MEDFNAKGKETATDDALFLERLEMLYEQSLTDLKAFADREGRPLDEVRRRMAELHSKYLFDQSAAGRSATDRKELIRRTLMNVSQQLESLETLAGLQSFFLVVDPNDQVNEGFLGGTACGREFWRGHRGCGSSGAQAFKARCKRPERLWQASFRPAAIDSALGVAPALPTLTGTWSKSPARELKATLYSAMRDALRAASGVRNAEMKWTNHSNLHVYGVRVVGWPDHVPLHNPSSLSVSQNQLLLEMLSTGRIRFVRLDGTQLADDSTSGEQSPRRDEEAMFEDSIDYSWVCGTDESHTTHTARESVDHVSDQSDRRAAADDRPSLRAESNFESGQISGPMIPKKRRLQES